MDVCRVLFAKRENRIALSIGFAIAVGLELFTRKCGFLLTSDSLQYLAAAASFKTERTFLCNDGSHYSYWQPLFPMILSFFFNPLSALTALNIIAKALLAAILLYLGDRFLENRFAKFCFFGTSLLSVYLLMISVFVWSELIFMALLYCNSYFALNLQQKNSFYWLLLTGFLLCLQRNAGLFWIVGVCTWLMIDKRNGLNQRLWHSLILFVVTTSGLWAWNIYNTFFIKDDFKFYDHAFFSDLYQNSVLILATITKMILPFTNRFLLAGSGLVCIIMIALFSYQHHLIKNLDFFIVTTGIYAAGYASMVYLDQYEMDRYFSVVSPHIYMLFFYFIDRFTFSAGTKLKPFIFFLILIWTVYPISRTIHNSIAWKERSCRQLDMTLLFKE